MTTPPSRLPPPHEAKTAKVGVAGGGSIAKRSKDALLHELRVHQAELEQQNEELRRAHGDLTLARDRYIDLFEFAPVSYLTLDREGRVIEANLTAADTLLLDRKVLLGSPFSRFVVPSDADRWQRLTSTAFRQGALRRIELSLVRHDGHQFHAQLECRRVVRANSKAQLRVNLTDVTQRHLAERNRRIATTGAVAHAAERRMTAIRLHEDLGQRLGMLKLQLSALALQPEAQAARSAVESMAAEIDQALVLVRRMSTDLYPLMLDNLGLGAALEWLVDDVSTRLGLTVALHLCEEAAAMDESLALSVYRLTEMALDHFARYVDTGVSIELLLRPRDLVLLIQCTCGHERPGADNRPMMAMSQGFRDQAHLMGARLERSELPDGTRRLSVFIERRGRVDGPAAGGDEP